MNIILSNSLKKSPKHYCALKAFSKTLKNESEIRKRPVRQKRVSRQLFTSGQQFIGFLSSEVSSSWAVCTVTAAAYLWWYQICYLTRHTSYLPLSGEGLVYELASESS